MRHFMMIFIVSICATACRTPIKPKGPRPAMPIMRVAHVSSTIVYSRTLEVEMNESLE